MYKLIIIDLDGTLLNDKKEVSEENANLINRAYKEKGVLCVIATGRSFMCAEYIANSVGDGLAQYIIASTGSIIKDCKNNVFLNKQCISQKTTMKILEKIKEYNLRGSVDIGTKIISNSRLANQEVLGKIGQKYEINENLIEYFTNNETESISFSIIGDPDKLTKIKQELETSGDLEITELCKSIDIKDNIKNSITYIDILSKGVTKKNAIKQLSDYLNIKREETVVIGDGGNDLPMFETAGLKVAMENSIEAVKEKADYITENNNNSGVAKAIFKILFNQN